ncbi:MAG: hypothetical protein ACI9U2_002711 [Bradymonadia bacterium]|jgi:hypothetical protein
MQPLDAPPLAAPPLDAPLGARPLRAARRREARVQAPRARPPAHPLWVIGAGASVFLALVIAPWVLAFGANGVWWGGFVVVLPAALIYGLVRTSPWALLVGVPVGWALPAFGLPDGAFNGAAGAVALVAVIAYIPTALGYLRERRVAAAQVEWTALDDTPGAQRRTGLTPWLAALLVFGPAAGAALSPTVVQRVAGGFPNMMGRAHVALTLVALLVGLALATDLARGRTAMPGDARRARTLAIVGALCLSLGAYLAR